MALSFANSLEPEADPDESGPDRLWFRSIFISNTHLGTPGCQAAALLEFLRATESDFLYLVGDIIDGWQLKRRWYWHQLHNDVVQEVLRKVRKGTAVVYVPGNHDEAARHYVGVDFGGIAIRDEAVHRTADGRRLLVTHGSGILDHDLRGAALAALELPRERVRAHALESSWARCTAQFLENLHPAHA